MPTNLYVDWWGDLNEQKLISDLMTESIQMFGVEVIYLPRILRREDFLYLEDMLSQFTQTFPIEVYLLNTQGYDGPGNFLSKFGLQSEMQMSVLMSRERFNEIVRTIVPRPTEGDWIFFPAPISRMFEIKYTEFEKSPGQYFPLGTRTHYKLDLEPITYSHEEIRTGNTVIDAFETQLAYSQELTFSDGSGAFVGRETVYQGETLTTATATGVVAVWTPTTTTLRVTDITGVFANGVSVLGATSGARYTLGATPDPLLSPNDPTHDNAYYETEIGSFIAGQQRNPFGS